MLVHIFGAAGSGTTSLGRQLAQQLGWVLLDVDDYYWLPAAVPFTEKRPEAERIGLLLADAALAGDCVVSGSLIGWGDAIMERLDLAVLVRTPTEERIRRLRRREAEQFGARIQPGGDMAEEHETFLRWAATYDVPPEGVGAGYRCLENHRAWLARLECPVLELDGTLPYEENVGRIRLALGV